MVQKSILGEPGDLDTDSSNASSCAQESATLTAPRPVGSCRWAPRHEQPYGVSEDSKWALSGIVLPLVFAR